MSNLFKILYLKSGNKPQNLIGSITGKKIILRWDKVNAINGFEVYCKVGNGKYKKIADTSKNSYTYKKLSKKKKKQPDLCRNDQKQKTALPDGFFSNYKDYLLS
jgi:fibronectin type 3 domain-containing protein